MRLVIFILSLTSCHALSCDFIRTVYNDRTCCEDSNIDTCLRMIPLCADITTGICEDSGTIKMKDINVTSATSYNDLTDRLQSDNTTVYISNNILHARHASTTQLGVVKIDGTTITKSNGAISGFSGNYNDLTNVPAGASVPDELISLTSPLEVDQTNVGFGIVPETVLHIGGSEEVNVTASRYECSGYYVLQTTGTVATPLTQAECTNYNGSLGSPLPPAEASLHTAGTACVGGTVTGGKNSAVDLFQIGAGYTVSSDDNMISISVCEQYANDNGYPYYRNAPFDQIYCAIYIDAQEVWTESAPHYCTSSDGCLTETMVYTGTNRSYLYEKSSGAPSLSVTEEECKAYATSVGRPFGTLNGNNNLPRGCVYGDEGYGSGMEVTYHTGSNTRPCGHQPNDVYPNAGSYSCVEKNSARSLQRTGFRETLDGPPSLSLTKNECEAYATSVSEPFRTIQDNNNMPNGCVRGDEGQGIREVFYHTGSSVRSCGFWYEMSIVPFSCIEAVLPETNMKSWCETECTTSASLWIDTANAQCTCGTESAETCTKESRDTTDLFSTTIVPTGCFVKDDVTYHNPNSGGDCTQTSVCLRKAVCMEESIASTTVAVSMISEDKAWFKNGIIVSSDSRIKKNIVEVSDYQALQQLRQIPTKFYDYVDSARGNRTIGFVAQEVKEVFPLAVSVGKGFVPNMMKRLKCHYWREAGDVDLRMRCEELIAGKTYRLFVSENGEPEKIVDVSVNSEGIAQMKNMYSSVFAYGEEVDDFHKLDKQKLFALAFSATQELDREVLQLKEQVAELIERVKVLESA